MLSMSHTLTFRTRWQRVCGCDIISHRVTSLLYVQIRNMCVLSTVHSQKDLLLIIVHINTHQFRLYSLSNVSAIDDGRLESPD